MKYCQQFTNRATVFTFEVISDITCGQNLYLSYSQEEEEEDGDRNAT
jgi:hypothetical protein